MRRRRAREAARKTLPGVAAASRFEKTASFFLSLPMVPSLNYQPRRASEPRVRLKESNRRDSFVSAHAGRLRGKLQTVKSLLYFFHESNQNDRSPRSSRLGTSTRAKDSKTKLLPLSAFYQGAIVLGDITALSRNSSTPVSQWDQRLTVVQKTASFLSAFPMFVPSLSWQNDRVYI